MQHEPVLLKLTNLDRFVGIIWIEFGAFDEGPRIQTDPEKSSQFPVVQDYFARFQRASFEHAAIHNRLVESPERFVRDFRDSFGTDVILYLSVQFFVVGHDFCFDVSQYELAGLVVEISPLIL